MTVIGAGAARPDRSVSGRPSAAGRARVAGHAILPLDRGWQAASRLPAPAGDPERGLPADELDGLVWRPATVPGTAAAVLRADGHDLTIEDLDLDGRDWWFRVRFDASPATAGEEVVLRLDGIATVANVFLNGELVLSSESMFAEHAVDVGGRLRGDNELVIHCHALGPRLAERRTPRARWRTRLVADGNLRWFRTMLLGRAPGFAPRPAAVGPWRPVALERRRAVAVDALALRPRIVNGTGILGVDAAVRTLDGRQITGARVIVASSDGSHGADLEVDVAAGDADTTRIRGSIALPDVARWWPHSHGDPTLHGVRLELDVAGEPVSIDAGRVGFRTLAAGPSPDHDVLRDGLALHLNGVPIFARGAVWTPLDIVGLAPSPDELRDALMSVRDAGMNMVRIPGLGAYETPEFHGLCDELGILVWQDLMFANLDYPFADEAFGRTAEAEVRQVIDATGGRPSLAVVCGNSEIEQQVAMLGLDPELGRGPFFGATVPTVLAAAGVDAIYIPSAPSGGDLPFRPDRGVANYYGVGGYRRPLSDARLAGVRFAAECLAFANVPDQELLDRLIPASPGSLVVHHPRWKAGVPRDNGSGWDFDDVRDHYLALLHGVDPGELRRLDHARYLELSRSVSGEVMAEVFGEWRRAASPSGGGLVLWLRDLVAGAGWGVVDSSGRPKVAWHHLRRALAPVAVWMTDEGLGGVDVHVANDRPEALAADLRVAVYRDGEQRIAEATTALALGPHETIERNVETLLGRFIDASWAYRFGPAGHDLIVATLERAGRAEPGGQRILSQAFRQIGARPIVVESGGRLGLEGEVAADAADATRGPDDGVRHSVVIRSRRAAIGVRVGVPGFRPVDDAFSIEPGSGRTVELRPLGETGMPVAGLPIGRLTALNLAGELRLGPPSGGRAGS